MDAMQQQQQQSSSSSSSSFTQEAPEFVAVVLASSVGTRLFPLTSIDRPKHSLPVVGQPMVVRLLHQLIAAGFLRTIVAVNETEDIAKSFGRHVVASDGTTGPASFEMMEPSGGGGGGGGTKRTMLVSIIRVPTACPSNVEALRMAMDHVPSTSHLVVLPGDLVVSDAQVLKDLVHLHRQAALTAECQRYQRHGAKVQLVPPPPTACTVLLTDVGEVSEQGVPLKESAKQKKGLLSRDEEDIDYILLEHSNGYGTSSSLPAQRLLWKQSKVDVEEDKDGVGATPKLHLPKARLSMSYCTLRLDWSDVHCYCLAPWVRNLIRARPSMQSIQNDLLPLLISRQFRGVAATFGSNAATTTTSADPSLLTDDTISLQADHHHHHHHHPSAKADNTGQDSSSATSYAVLAHVAPNLVFRANTVAAYLYANKVEQGRGVVPSGATYNAKFRSVVLPNCTIGDKVTFQTTVVGKNCTLGHKCRLNNVVLMDNVVVGDNTILQNTIVGRGSVIGDNCNLNDCQIAPNATLPTGTKKKGEALMEGDFTAS